MLIKLIPLFIPIYPPMDIIIMPSHLVYITASSSKPLIKMDKPQSIIKKDENKRMGYSSFHNPMANKPNAINIKTYIAAIAIL